MKLNAMMIMALTLAAACSKPDDHVYTLYRSSALVADMRAHVATFDPEESEKHNRENCETARDLFQNQPGVTVKYWCEKGHYRK